MRTRLIVAAVSAVLLLLVVTPAGTPTTGSWSPTGSMAIARSQGFTLTLLPSGKVLVAGGLTGASSSAATETAELYEPGTGVWAPTADMSVQRSRHTATLLPDGRVLVAGGLLSDGTASAAAEIYNPAAGAWTPAASMNVPRLNFVATRLADGRVLVTGGVSDNGQPGAGNAVTKSAEIYDPATDRWTLVARMAHQRYVHAAALLPDGRVLVTGGSGVTIHCMMRSTAEVYDPGTDAWTNVPSMAVARSTHLAETLPDGHVLVAGGWSLPVKNCGNDGILEVASMIGAEPCPRRSWRTAGCSSPEDA